MHLWQTSHRKKQILFYWAASSKSDWAANDECPCEACEAGEAQLTDFDGFVGRRGQGKRVRGSPSVGAR